MFFISLSIYLFTKVYFKEGDKRLIYLILPTLFIGCLFRFTVGLIIITLLIFLLTTKRFSLFKEKEWYISSILGLLTFVPYMIYSQINYGNPIKAISYVLFTGEGQRSATPIKVLLNYITYFPNYFHWIFLILFILGLLVCLFYLVVSFDLLHKKKEMQRFYFLVLMIVIPILFFGLYINHFEDRYILMTFPFICLTIGYMTNELYAFFSKYNKMIITAVLVVLFCIAGYSDLSHTDNLIKSKVESYKDFKLGGEWILENTNKQDIVFATGQPQFTYYSERPTFSYPQNREEFINNISYDLSDNGSRYFVVSIWEQSPQWVYEMFSNQAKYTPVKVYTLNGKVSTAIFRE